MDFANMRQRMVDSQVRVNDVTDPEIVGAFLNTPREAFVSKSQQASAYAEYEVPTSEGRALWTPRDTAKMMKFLAPRSGDIALVIAAGAGYEAALLSRMVETVIALENQDDLVDEMSNRFAKLGVDSAVAVKGDLAKGLPDQGPFDIIFVCGMVEVVPHAWIEQLAEGGRLGVVNPVGRGLGRVRIHTRSGASAAARDAFEACPPVLKGFQKAPVFEF